MDADLGETVYKAEGVRKFLISTAGKELLESMSRIVVDAQEELLHTNPEEMGKIAQLQERVKAHQHLMGLFDQAVQVGDLAYNQIKENYYE